MEESQTIHPFANSISEDSGFELNLHKLSCEKSCAEDEQCICTNMTENVLNQAQPASYHRLGIKKDHVIDVEVSVDEIFHLQSSHEQLAGHDPTSEEDKVYKAEDIGVCKELISDVRLHKSLIKSATFPSSEVDSLNFFYPEINGASTSTIAPDQNSSADQIPMYKRSISLPASSSSQLVSAMKGGRTQNKTSSDMDMRVKWAEDVYDPPPTSMSHTVKSYNIQRPKSRKKDNHRQKHNKGKNSRGNTGGKRPPSRGNAGILSAPFPPKLQCGGANGPAARSEDISEFADAKCGSVFLRESLTKVHLSFSEAT